MSDFSVVPIKGRVARLISLNECGNPITGASSLVVVTKGFIQIAASPQYEDGEQHRQRLADGSFCVKQDDPDELVNVLLTVDFCGVCPSVSKVTTGSRLLSDGASGTGAAYSDQPSSARFSLELWQLVTGKAACDPATGLQRYVYWAWPNVGNGRVNDTNHGNESLTLQIQAKAEPVGPLWGDGPGSDGPWAPAFEENEVYLWNITTVAPPTIPSNCGAVTLT